MTDQRPTRILWLLNHSTLRKFELTQLRAMGITEVFLPKKFPYDEGNLSADVDWSVDPELSIPDEDLAILNEQDWYGSPSDAAWEIANKHFDVAIIGFFPKQISSVAKRFKGQVVLRVFGLSRGLSYTELLYETVGTSGYAHLLRLGARLWFGAGYDHLYAEEGSLLQRQNLYLPVGLAGADRRREWTGAQKKILFVCPRIGTQKYFSDIYDEFKETFEGFSYTVGGAQPLPVKDHAVIGYVSYDDHLKNMREHRVMFYHSREPNHIHYHPFEAVRAGMPLVFMSGGLLDRLGGKDVPGRARTKGHARMLVRRLLDADTETAKRYAAKQAKLLEAVDPALCGPIYQAGIRRVLDAAARIAPAPAPVRAKKISVLVPLEIKGGSLRGAKALAETIERGSRLAGEAAEVVLHYVDHDGVSKREDFRDLRSSIATLPFRWQELDQVTAQRAMIYAGFDNWRAEKNSYLAVRDGVKQLADCDLVIVISDRLLSPMLPMKPYVMMVYDYLQRYSPVFDDAAYARFLDAGRRAQRVLTTTRFTYGDALQFGGIPKDRVRLVPMLAPNFSETPISSPATNPAYFIWTTNAGPHKNHLNALEALKLYYERYDGALACRVTGVNTDKLLKGSQKHLRPVRELFARSDVLKKNIRFLGELDDDGYKFLLSRARFLLHAGMIDNGTFGVVEAGQLGVPSLSSDYPAMREINEAFGLDLSWMDPRDPREMASRLKDMEVQSLRMAPLARRAVPESPRDDENARIYWDSLRDLI